MTDERTSGDCTCGGKIAPSRRDGFCSSWCASRDAQGLPPQSPPARFPSPPTVLAPVDSAVDGTSAQVTGSSSTEASGDDDAKRPSYRQRRRLIADEYERRLSEAGMLEHWQAASILDLADALDWNRGSLASRATAHRELERQMTNLLRGIPDESSKLGKMQDEVRARREARAARRAGGA